MRGLMSVRRAGALAAVIALTGGVWSTAAAAKTTKPAKGELVVEEDFTEASDWAIVDQEASGALAVDGEVLVELRDVVGHRVFGPDVTLPASYAVEADATLREGDPEAGYWGVMCRATLDQAYYFVISTDGYAAVLREAPNEFDRLDDGDDKAAQRRAKKAIERGDGAVNRIRGECYDDGRLRLFVNNKFVLKVRDANLIGPGTRFALAAFTESVEDGNLVVAFDDAKMFDLG